MQHKIKGLAGMLGFLFYSANMWYRVEWEAWEMGGNTIRKLGDKKPYLQKQTLVV